MKNNKHLILALFVAGLLIWIAGATLAYWSWTSTNAQKTNVTFTIGANFSCGADGGGNITNTNYLVPTDCDNETYAIKREITVNTTCNYSKYYLKDGEIVDGDNHIMQSIYNITVTKNEHSKIYYCCNGCGKSFDAVSYDKCPNCGSDFTEEKYDYTITYIGG